MNLPDYIVLTLTALAVFAAVRHSVRRRRSGAGPCGGCCSNCSGCHAADKK